MKKGILLGIIQLIVVGCVLGLTVISYAWFTSNAQVYSSNVILTAAETSEVSIVVEPGEYAPYKGETGLGYIDAENPDLANDMPYLALKKFTMNCAPLSQFRDYAFCAYFTDFSIDKSDETVINATNDPLIVDAFTFRFYIYDENWVQTAAYAPENGTNFIVLTSGTEETNGSYLLIEEEMTLKCGFELVFLSETSYSNWLNANYSAQTPFRYCDYEYMRAMFNVTFQVGMDVPPST